MSQPPVPYDRIFDFETFSTTNPTVQQPGVQIDGELDAVKVTLDSLISRLAEVQRSDGKLNPSAFETTGIPESIAAQAYTIVYAQLQPLVLTSAQSASAASASAATAGNHANAAAASASAANAAIAPAVAAKDQAVLKAAEAQASAVSANASASTSASAKVESESYRDQALVARDEANQALSSINILKGNIDNRYGNLLDADQNLADVASKSQSVTNLGLDATDPSHRGLYNRVCSLVHMYVDPKTNQFLSSSPHLTADSFLEARFGLVFNHNTGLFSASQFGGSSIPDGGSLYNRPPEVVTNFVPLSERVEALKNRLSVMGWIFQNTLLTQTSNLDGSNYGDNRLVTLYDYSTNPGNAIGSQTWLHVQNNVSSAISNHYTSNDVPMDNKQYVRKNRAWLELTGVGGGSGISDYDNFKVYNAGEVVHLSGELYRFNAFIGAAGYGPVTHPEAWTKLTASVIADISGLQTALDEKAQLSGATFTGDVGISSSSSFSYRVSRTISPTLTYTSTLGHSLVRVGFSDFGNAFGYLSATEMRVGNSGGEAPTGYISAYTNTTGAFNPNITLVELGPAAIINGRQTIIKEGKFLVNNGDGTPDFEPYLTSASLGLYAPLSGATFTGRVNLPSRTPGGIAFLNLGLVPDNLTVPSTPVEGDIFFHDSDSTTGLNVRLTYTAKNFSGTLTNYSVAVLQNQNFFTQPNTISCSHNTQAALRITQLGNGNAFVVEDDSGNPDQTPFTINNNGRVGIGIAPDATAALRLDSNGIKFGTNSVVQAVQAVVTSTGTYDKEIPVTIDGVNYRIPCRQV